MAYANLDDAGNDAWDNLYAWWMNGATAPNTMQAKLALFCTACLPSFPDSSAGNHPVANWLALIDGLASTIGAAAPTLAQLAQAADYVYRICLLTEYLRSTAALISAAQYTVVLNAFNTYLNAF